MKVFVTGASGFVGEEILRQLHAAGHRIRLLARNPHSPRAQAAIANYQAEVVSGNVLDAAPLTQAVKNSDALIHLVGIIGEVGKNTFENVHVRGTQNIVTAAQQAGVRRFIQMSALGTRPHAVSRYHRSKWAAEEIVRQSGLDHTIFRPSIIYGPHDHFVNLFATLSRFSPVMPIIGDGRSKLQPIPVRDVARCFVGALTEPKSSGLTYDLGGEEVLSFEAILDTILEVTRRKRWKLHLPLPLARFQAALLEFIYPKLLHKVSPLSRDQILMLQEDNVGNARPADELFGLKPLRFKTGIAEYLQPK